MISLEYHKYFLDATPQRYIDLAKAMGKKDADNPNDFILCLTDLMEKCNVKDLKMSDYGIDNEDFAKYANSALETMYGAFQADNKPLPFEEIVGIYQRSYK